MRLAMVAEGAGTGDNENLAQTKTIRLVCWNREAVMERAAALERAGLAVNASPLKTTGLATQFAKDPPAAIAIDLDRLPSHGLAVGDFLRRAKTTRYIPLVFLGGVEAKVARVRERLPDAHFAGWKGAAKVIQSALKKAVTAPVVPPPMFGHTSSLAKKLGVKAGMQCALIAATAGFEETLDDLPEGFEFQKKVTSETTLIIWWLRTRAEMEHAAALLGERMLTGTNVWFVFPKKSGGIEADFGAYDVRATCLEAGLVDFKICAVDGDWTGMKFARKRK